MSPTVRRLFASAAIAFGAAPVSHAMAGPKAVVELFTSQGCSSCPPADALLKELARDPNVLALSFNVDYWDYLGWKDTLASPEHTQRQRAYAEARGDRSVYTPQMVVNGRQHLVGSDRGALRAALGDQDRRTPLSVPVEMTVAGETLRITVGAAEAGAREKAGDVWLVFYDRTHDVAIPRGENKGRIITYTNVVRRIQAVGMWKGETLTLELPKSQLAKLGASDCAVILQSEVRGRPGPILGAAVMPAGQGS